MCNKTHMPSGENVLLRARTKFDAPHSLHLFAHTSTRNCVRSVHVMCWVASPLLAGSFKQKLKLIVEYDIFDMNGKNKWVYGMDCLANPQNISSAENKFYFFTSLSNCVPNIACILLHVCLVELKKKSLVTTANLQQYMNANVKLEYLLHCMASSRHTKLLMVPLMTFESILLNDLPLPPPC